MARLKTALAAVAWRSRTACRFVGLASIAAQSVACDTSPEIVDRAVVIHVPTACAGDMQDVGAAAFSIYQAGGDYNPGSITPSDGTPLNATGAALSDLPSASKSITIDVKDNTSSEWSGLSLIAAQGDVDVLAWPTKNSCALDTSVERDDASIGPFDDHHVLVVGGSSPRSFLANMQTGLVDAMHFGLATMRTSATITPFGNGALVAGGSDLDSNAPLDTAEVYVHAEPIGDFDQTPIFLTKPRTMHGAVALANGTTLLVGGTDDSGRALHSMDIIDPVSRRATSAGAVLQYARFNPTVMRLASGEVLVAGGYTPGIVTVANPNPANVMVPWLEWFKPDGSGKTKEPANLVACANQAFVPLEAGGALAVIAPDDTCLPSGDTEDFHTTWVISGTGTLEAANESVPGIKGDDVRLYRGVNGSPMLFTGSAWFRYEPWFGEFDTVDDAPSDGPRGAMTTADNGLALWLENSGNNSVGLVGYRFGTNNAYTTIPPNILTTGPDYFAPDDSSIAWDSRGVLDIPVGTTAMIADATFASFTLDFVSPSGSTPLVVLRDDSGNELDVGGPECALLIGSAIHVERHGAVVSFSEDNSPLTPCGATVDPTARLHVGLAGSQSVNKSFASSFTIVRTDD